jgi:hypothetical protein
MIRLVRLPVALLLAAASAIADDAPPALAKQTSDAKEPATTTPAPPAKRERPISNNLAATLAASMPKYNPPPKPKPEDEEVDLREVDKPRNGIIRLPKYTVREAKPPVFRERDIHTNAGLADLARRRYLTPTYRLLNGFYIPFFTQSPTEHALAMYAEDERLNNMAELDDNAQTVGRNDAAAGAYIKRLSNETYMRTDTFGGTANTR